MVKIKEANRFVGTAGGSIDNSLINYSMIIHTTYEVYNWFCGARDIFRQRLFNPTPMLLQCNRLLQREN